MSNPPGLILPTQNSYAVGAGTPRDSSIASMKSMDVRQATLAASVGGRKRRGGAASQVVVPQYQMLYQPAGSDPNGIIKDSSSISMQGAAWSKNDSQAAVKGGSRRRRTKRRRCRNRKCKTKRRRHHRR